MISSPHHAWVLRVSQADSYKALNGLMEDWYQTAKAAHDLQSAIGFESYMGWVPRAFRTRSIGAKMISEVADGEKTVQCGVQA